MKKSFKNSGFMMVEIMIVASIAVVSILAAMTVAQKSVQVSFQASHTVQAGFLLEEGAESVRIVRDNDWSNISSLIDGTTYYPDFNGGTWILSTTPNTVGIFTRTVVLSSVNRDSSTKDIVNSGGSVDIDTKLVTVTLSWLEGGVLVTKDLEFYIMNVFS